MPGFVGADTTQLRAFSTKVSQGAERLEALGDSLARAVAAARWDGPDAEAFRETWSGYVGPSLDAYVAQLRRHGENLRQQAEDQDSASGAHGADWASRGDGPQSGYRSDSSDEDGERKPLDPQDRNGDPEIPQSMEDWDKNQEGHQEPDGPIDLDVDRFTSDSINQHGVGDCWFLASLGATARANPEFLRQHIEDNGDGTYTVTMYDQGKPVDITVNGTFNSAGVQGGGGEPNWASIYEKAAAEYMGGSYSDLNGDQPELALEMITGNDAHYDDDASLEDIQAHLAEGPVVVDTKPEKEGWWLFQNDHVEKDTVVPNHSYIVEGVENQENPPGSGDMQPMIHVRNPWGPGAEQNDKAAGDLWLTRDEFDENFRRTNYVQKPETES